MSTALSSVSGVPAFYSSNIPKNILDATVGDSLQTQALQAQAIVPTGIAANQVGSSLTNPELLR